MSPVKDRSEFFIWGIYVKDKFAEKQPSNNEVRSLDKRNNG